MIFPLKKVRFKPFCSQVFILIKYISLLPDIIFDRTFYSLIISTLYDGDEVLSSNSCNVIILVDDT